MCERDFNGGTDAKPSAPCLSGEKWRKQKQSGNVAAWCCIPDNGGTAAPPLPLSIHTETTDITNGHDAFRVTTWIRCHCLRGFKRRSLDGSLTPMRKNNISS